jgi:23S rRNA pseudouridine1911/1915/1917 synthase
VTPHLANQAAEILATNERPALHARALRFGHPRSGQPMAFESPLPQDIRRLIHVCGLEIHTTNEIE